MDVHAPVTLTRSRELDPVLWFEFAPGLSMVASGDVVSRRHLADEYGPALRSAGDGAGVRDDRGPEEPAVSLELSSSVLRSTPWSGTTFRDRRRITRWTVRLGDPNQFPLRLAIGVSGVFGRSFVQGIVLEPTLGLAAARSERVLLPAAAMALREGLVLVLGGSRAGKSSLTARAIAAGNRVLGDDQVLVERDGAVRPFPRRLRLYPDLVESAPLAYRALPPGARRRLEILGIVSALSGGLIGLPLLVPAETIARGSARARQREHRHSSAVAAALGFAPGQFGTAGLVRGSIGSGSLDAFGGPLDDEFADGRPGEPSAVERTRTGQLPAGSPAMGSLPNPGEEMPGSAARSGIRGIARVIVLDHGSSASPAVDLLSTDELVAVAGQLIDGQRERLVERAGEPWRAAFEAEAPLERSILASAFGGVTGERLRVPVGWPVARVFDSLAVELGLDR